MPSSKTQAKDTPPPLPVALSYLEESRHFATGFLLVVPLLLAYQIGLMALRSDVVNWADGTIRLVFRLFGPAEPLLFAATVATLVAVSLWHAEQLRIDLELFGLMLAESVAYALALGLVCSFLSARLVPMSAAPAAGTVAHDLVLSAGAGVYEEVLFRVILLGGLHYAIKTWTKCPAGVAAFLAIVVSSAAFAASHHVGPYGEFVELGLLARRFSLGIIFSALYVFRGLGIVVYTHAFYDAFVSLSR